MFPHGAAAGMPERVGTKPGNATKPSNIEKFPFPPPIPSLIWDLYVVESHRRKGERN